MPLRNVCFDLVADFYVFILLAVAVPACQPATTNVKEDFIGAPPLPEVRPAMVGSMTAVKQLDPKMPLGNQGRRGSHESYVEMSGNDEEDEMDTSRTSAIRFAEKLDSGNDGMNESGRRSITFTGDGDDLGA